LIYSDTDTYGDSSPNIGLSWIIHHDGTDKTGLSVEAGFVFPPQYGTPVESNLELNYRQVDFVIEWNGKKDSGRTNYILGNSNLRTLIEGGEGATVSGDVMGDLPDYITIGTHRIQVVSIQTTHPNPEGWVQGNWTVAPQVCEFQSSLRICLDEAVANGALSMDGTSEGCFLAVSAAFTSGYQLPSACSDAVEPAVVPSECKVAIITELSECRDTSVTYQWHHGSCAHDGSDIDFASGEEQRIYQSTTECQSRCSYDAACLAYQWNDDGYCGHFSDPAHPNSGDTTYPSVQCFVKNQGTTILSRHTAIDMTIHACMRQRTASYQQTL
jgi:hypothetical protein